jgi:hypothetical protein
MTRSSFEIGRQGFLPRSLHLILCNVFDTRNIEGSYQCYFFRTKESVIINAKNHEVLSSKFWLAFSELFQERAPLEYRGVFRRPVILFPVLKRSGSVTCRDPAQNHLWFIHRRVITYSYGLGFICGRVRNFRNAFRAIVTRVYRPCIC